MSAIEELRSGIPDYAKDLKLNLQSVLTQSSLDEAQVWSVAAATAIATRNAGLREAVLADAQDKLSPEQLDDARAAASLMGMNNVYYRFKHFMGDESEYKKLPARLRMNRIGRPLGDKVIFEMMSLAVSAIAGCELCVRSHEAVLEKAGVTRDQVHDAIRIAATMNGLGVALDQ